MPAAELQIDIAPAPTGQPQPRFAGSAPGGAPSSPSQKKPGGRLRPLSQSKAATSPRYTDASARPVATPMRSQNRSKTSVPACRHCGTAIVDEARRESGFCCAGCAYVYRLIHESGLDAYYRIKDQITAPVDPGVFQPQDYDWLAELQREAEAASREQSGDSTPAATTAAAPPPPALHNNEVARAATATAPPRQETGSAILGIQGISCAGCVWLIERCFEQLPGARRINVNAQLGHMELSWEAGEFSLPGFARQLQSFNYLIGPHDADSTEPESRALVRRIGLCTAFVMNTMLFTLPTYFGMEQSFAYARLFGTLSLTFGTLSMLAGGGYFIQRAWAGLRHGLLHIDLPISLGILGAYLGSLYGWASGAEHYVYFDFVSMFIVLMLIGRWAQVCAVERNRRRLLSLQPRPQHIAVFQPDGTTRPLAPEKLQPGHSLELRSGQVLPVEARLEAPARAEFSLASINGEAAPRAYAAGQLIPAGALNLGRAPVRLRATQGWTQSLLAELTAHRHSAATAPNRNPLLERIVQGYLIGILAIAALAALGWGLGTGDLLKTGAVVTAILVVSCPCAVGLAFPLAEEIASVALRRRGVYVRSPRLWSILHKVRKLVFDKTGTLTLETPILQNPEALATLGPEARQALYSLVRDNPHPVSQSLLEALLAAGPAPEPLAGEVVETIGQGVRLGPWSLGRRSVPEVPIPRGTPDEEAAPKNRGATILSHNDQPVARFVLADTIRSDARAELRRLHELGFEAHILSGDASAKVETTAAELGLPPGHGHGQMSPQDKADWLRRHTRGDALMLGDGLNDSLAFDAALARGTPVIHRGVLARKSDFYYLGRGIGGIRALFEINTIRRRAERLILIFSVTYNLLAVGSAAAGLINPLVAAILMPVNALLTLALVSLSMRGALAKSKN